MRIREASVAEIDQAVKRLQGQFVWHSLAHNVLGPVFTLEFGPTLAPDETQAAFSLIVDCGWRVVEADRILLTWHEYIEDEVVPALKALQGLQVTEVTVSAFGDLSLHFATGRTLHIWNDAPYEEGDSWLLSQADSGEYAVACRNWFTYSPENRHNARRWHTGGAT